MDVKGAKALSERLAEAARNVDPPRARPRVESPKRRAEAVDPDSKPRRCRGIDAIWVRADARRAAPTVALGDQQPVNTHFRRGAAGTSPSA